MKLTKEDKQKLAAEILLKTKEKLKDDFPSLIYPINMLELRESQKKMRHLCTDGESILYSPSEVIDVFKRRGFQQMKTEMIHILLHGLLGHLEMDGRYKNRMLLWATMDLEVGRMINQLVLDASADLSFVNNIRMWDECYEDMHGMELYYQKRNSTDRETRVFQSDKGICFDNHRYWRKWTANRSGNDADSGNEQEGGKRERICKKWSEARQMLGSEDGNEIAKTLKKDHKNAKSQGSGAGMDSHLVVAAEKNEISYQNVLREFFKMKEDPREDPEAIDKALYQYGLDLYGNVPLIEPSDSEERLKVNTICLAMDSSGSCDGEIASQFLRETWNIFHDIQRFSPKCELYLFVCDDEIQQEEHYETMEMLRESDWMEKELDGWGGTSFVPVFERIQELQEEESKQIDCLIYLTDSYGGCIEEEPNYPVFFVLPEDQTEDDGSLEYNNCLPEWIRYVRLGMEE